MEFKASVLCLSAFVAFGSSLEIQPIQHVLVLQTPHNSSPREFPKNTDPSTPILTGEDPKLSNLPPKMFPNVLPDSNPTGPPVLSGSEANITQIKNDHEAKLNETHKNDEMAHLAPVESTTKVPTGTKTSAEQEDMLHSKYKGGQDVDELLKPEKKATEKDEKKPIVPKKEPKSEFEVTSDFEKNGPKLMNETKTKTRESMLESTSKMMAVSSSVLSSTQPKHRSILEPAKTVVSVLLSLVVIVGLGVIGLLVWRRISQRRFGRDVLINEDDMDDVADMHSFDRAQIQIT